MTTPKTAQEFVDLLIKNHQEDWGKIEFPQYFKDHALKILKAYLLQESAPLVGALNYINHLANQEGEQVGYSIKSQRVAQKALLCFQKKHGGVV